MAATYIDIRIAARGVDYANWKADFYPDDLPEDWRLSYYSNEFRALVIPEAQWHEADEATLGPWLEDSHEDFRFYVEVSDWETDWPTFVAKASLLKAQMGGILLRPRQWPATFDCLRDTLEASTAIAPVSLLLPNGQELDEAEQQLLRVSGVELAWQPVCHSGEGEPGSYAAPPWRGVGDLCMACLPGDMTCSPRQWREIIGEALQVVAQFDPADVIILLMFDGQAPDMESMHVASTLGDMLGAAHNG